MNHEILIPTQVSIREITPLLADKQRVYANTITGQLSPEITLNILNYKHKEIASYKGQKAECLLEIIDAEFRPLAPDSEEPVTPDLMELKYLGYHSGADFFPTPHEAVQKDGKIDKQLHQVLLEENMANYGEHGFGLNASDNQPVMQTTDGCVLLVNKYLYKDLLMKTRKGTWLTAKINKVKLLSIAEISKHTPQPLAINRLEEQEKLAKVSKPRRRKVFGLF